MITTLIIVLRGAVAVYIHKDNEISQNVSKDNLYHKEMTKKPPINSI